VIKLQEENKILKSQNNKLLVENNAFEKILATLISKKNTKPKPRYKAPKKEWRQPRWKPQPKKRNEMQIWISKGVVQTMRSLDHKITNFANAPNLNVSKVTKSFDLNETKFKGLV